MNKKIRLATIRRISTKSLSDGAYKKTKNFRGLKIAYIFFNFIYEKMKKYNFIEQYFDEIVTDVYDYTPSKEKLLSHKVLEAIHNYERDFRVTVSPDTHIIVMGEDTYFEIVHEQHITTPFFYKPMEFSTDLSYHDPYYGRCAAGYKVHVVPGLDGFLILPKTIVEKKNS